MIDTHNVVHFCARCVFFHSICGLWLLLWHLLVYSVDDPNSLRNDWMISLNDMLRNNIISIVIKSFNDLCRYITMWRFNDLLNINWYLRLNFTSFHPFNKKIKSATFYLFISCYAYFHYQWISLQIKLQIYIYLM